MVGLIDLCYNGVGEWSFDLIWPVGTAQGVGGSIPWLLDLAWGLVVEGATGAKGLGSGENVMKLSFALATTLAIAAILFSNPILWLPATFFLILGFGLWLQQRHTPDTTPPPITPREPLTEWNPANAARRGESKAERHKRLRELAQDENASWGRWSGGE
jgi:hypothetical protein